LPNRWTEPEPPAVYCKDHPDEKIIHANGVVFKDMRAEMGIKMK
jgi:hypothetical protein